MNEETLALDGENNGNGEHITHCDSSVSNNNFPEPNVTPPIIRLSVEEDEESQNTRTFQLIQVHHTAPLKMRIKYLWRPPAYANSNRDKNCQARTQLAPVLLPINAHDYPKVLCADCKNAKKNKEQARVYYEAASNKLERVQQLYKRKQLLSKQKLVNAHQFVPHTDRRAAIVARNTLRDQRAKKEKANISQLVLICK